MRIITMFLAAAILFGLFAPLSIFASPNNPEFELSAEEQSYLDTIKDKPVSLAVTSELASFVNSKGERSGLLQPLINLMENEWGLTVETVNPGWGEGLDMLDSGEADLIGLMISNEKRRGKYYHTEPIYSSNMDVYTRGDTPFASIVEMKGKTVGLLSDSALPEMIEVYLTPEGMVKYYDTIEELILALERGEVLCIATALTIQSELLKHPDVRYEISVESVIAPQCIYSGNERVAPLIDLINRYVASPEGDLLVGEINSNRRKCMLEKYSEFYKDDIAYVKEKYDKLRIFDSGMLYPLSYVQNGKYYGLQNEINDIVYEITGIPVEAQGYSSFGGMEDVVSALRKGDILAIAGIHRINEYSRDPSFEYSLTLMTDTLSFYVRQSNYLSSLSEMRVGSVNFGGSYMDWKNIPCKSLQIYESREMLTEDLRGNKLDAVFIGEMMTDYYYTVLHDYTLKRFDNLTVPASVNMLYNAGNGSFNRLMNAAVDLQAVINPADRQIWSNSSQNEKFELMWLRSQMDRFRARMSLVTILLAIVLAMLLVFAMRQLRKFRNFDRQISRMLSVQGNADMFWGNLKTNRLISKGDYPISKKLGFSEELTQKITNVESIRKDIENIDGQGLAYYTRNIELTPENSDASYFFRRFTHKINENEFMMFVIDYTAEKYRERELSRLANTDFLTKLLNRRAMDELLSKKAEGLSGRGEKIYIFMLDIDNFKNVNDSYGHDIGDKVLGIVAGVIEGVLSKGNVARWGGEEFLGVAVFESREKAVELAQRILYNFASVEVTVGEKKSFSSTISCGVSELDRSEAYINAINRADKALYQAKHEGKNCVRFIGGDGKPGDGESGYQMWEAEPLDVSITYSRIMSRVVQAFFNSSIDTVIMELLRITTVHNGLDRAYLLEKTDEGVFNSTYVYDPQNLAVTSPISSIDAEEIARSGNFSLSEPRFISDTHTGITEKEAAVRASGLRSFAQLPVFANGGLIALLVFDNCHEPHEWTSDEHRILGDMAVIVGEFIIRKNLEMELMRTNSTMSAILDSIDDIVCVIDPISKSLLFANKKLRDIAEISAYGEKACWEALCPDSGGPCGFCAHGRLLNESSDSLKRSVRRDVYNPYLGIWFDVTDTVIDWDGGKRAVVMVCHDITANKNKDIRMQKTLNELEWQKEMLDFALEGANSFSWEYTPSLDKVVLSATTEAALGYPLEYFEMKHSKYVALIVSDYMPEARKKLDSYINGLDDVYSAEYPMVTANGEIKWFLDRGKFADDKRDVIYGVCTDITDSKLHERRLSELAYTDTLTGMFNKQYLLDGMIKPSSDDFKNFGGVLLDIKSFKNINEAFGFDYGNRIIVSIAKRISGIFKDKTIVKVSGDRFLCVLENTSIEELKGYAEKVLEEFEKPLITEGQMHKISFKVGIALNADSNAIKLLSGAEIALYSAKESIAADCRVLDDSIRRSFNKKASMEFELEKAIEKQEFVMYYQPKVCTATRRVIGAEALIRWNHPENGIVPPLDFIPLAEETGLIIPIGEFVINESAKQLREWLDSGMDIFLSFNLSVKQFLSPRFKKHIQAALEEYRIPDDKLIIEITESTMISDFDYVNQVLCGLNSLGMGVSLDDFGTGYSSMSYLGKISLNYLKIDKAFICNAVTESKDRAILESIISMSRKLGFKVTAEGVETAVELEMLEELGCDIIQGFYFSKPLPKEEFEAFIKSWEYQN